MRKMKKLGLPTLGLIGLSGYYGNKYSEEIYYTLGGLARGMSCVKTGLLITQKYMKVELLVTKEWDQ